MSTKSKNRQGGGFMDSRPVRRTAEQIVVSLFLGLMTILMTMSLCRRKKTPDRPSPGKYAPYANSREYDRRRKSDELSEEVTALSALWPPSSQSLSKSKSTFSKHQRIHKTQSEPDIIMRPTKQLRPSTSGSKDRSKMSGSAESGPAEVAAVSKLPPQDVDMNDFIVKAAASQVVVDPALVKKKGNIDDEIADPAKTKARLKQVEDEMKSVNATIEDDKKDAKTSVSPGIKWGDAKCVVYETRDQVTLEDDIDDAADMY